jgi:hypothetical protein
MPKVPGPHTSCVISLSTLVQMFWPGATLRLLLCRAKIFSVNVCAFFTCAKTPACLLPTQGSARVYKRALLHCCFIRHQYTQSMRALASRCAYTEVLLFACVFASASSCPYHCQPWPRTEPVVAGDLTAGAGGADTAHTGGSGLQACALAACVDQPAAAGANVYWCQKRSVKNW